MSSWWCWRIGPQKWWKLRQRSRRPPKNTSGILGILREMFSGFLGGGLISTSEHELADSHGRFQITITGSQCLREALWEMQRSQTCCAVLFFITLHPLNPSSILDPNACAFHLASLCPGPTVGRSWCQEQGPGKPWWFLMISHLTRMIQHEVR